ncbi:hypothetical protein DL769_010038 [Monosporascus sp. CRB-8-3]|nr:hypothetical protein DL769_010038 [Monosporascus sp. CRB-8-3]
MAPQDAVIKGLARDEQGVDEDAGAELGVDASREPPESVNGSSQSVSGSSSRYPGSEVKSPAPDEAREYLLNEHRLQDAFGRHGNGGYGLKYPFLRELVLTVGLV